MNLDLLGQREPGIYGSAGLADLEKQLRAVAPGIAAAIGWPGVQLTFFQTNREHEFLEKISEGWDGALLNPGAWTHTSLAGHPGPGNMSFWKKSPKAGTEPC